MPELTNEELTEWEHLIYTHKFPQDRVAPTILDLIGALRNERKAHVDTVTDCARLLDDSEAAREEAESRALRFERERNRETVRADRAAHEREEVRTVLRAEGRIAQRWKCEAQTAQVHAVSLKAAVDALDIDTKENGIYVAVERLKDSVNRLCALPTQETTDV